MQKKEWHNHFKVGRTSVESGTCYYRPLTSQINEVFNQIQKEGGGGYKNKENTALAWYDVGSPRADLNVESCLCL